MEDFVELWTLSHLHSKHRLAHVILICMPWLSCHRNSLSSLLSRHPEQVSKAQCLPRTFPLLVCTPAVVTKSLPWAQWSGWGGTVDMSAAVGDVGKKLSAASQRQD